MVVSLNIFKISLGILLTFLRLKWKIKNDRFIAVRWENFLGESAHDRSYGNKSRPDINNAVGSQNHCSKFPPGSNPENHRISQTNRNR